MRGNAIGNAVGNVKGFPQNISGCNCEINCADRLTIIAKFYRKTMSSFSSPRNACLWPSAHACDNQYAAGRGRGASGFLALVN